LLSWTPFSHPPFLIPHSFRAPFEARFFLFFPHYAAFPLPQRPAPTPPRRVQSPIGWALGCPFLRFFFIYRMAIVTHLFLNLSNYCALLILASVPQPFLSQAGNNFFSILLLTPSIRPHLPYFFLNPPDPSPASPLLSLSPSSFFSPEHFVRSRSLRPQKTPTQHTHRPVRKVFCVPFLGEIALLFFSFNFLFPSPPPNLE